jgi:hypothetical protein
MSSKKFDQGKVPLSLLPISAKAYTARAFEFGAKKYGLYNYLEGGFTTHQLISATLRHIDQHLDGEDHDVESGCFHVAHACANLMILMEQMALGILIDDRRMETEESFDEGANV